MSDAKPFVPPYKYQQEIVYIFIPASKTPWGDETKELTKRAVYIGHSYLEDGNDAPPNAIIEVGSEQIRVPFNLTRPVD